MVNRRIRRPKDKGEIFNILTDGEEAIFESYKDLLLFAACVGYAEGKSTEFSQSLEPISFSVFSGECDVALFDIMAISHTGDTNILEPQNDKYLILEHYANAGLEILRNEIIEAPGNILDNFINLISKQTESQKEDPIDILSGIGDGL